MRNSSLDLIKKPLSSIYHFIDNIKGNLTLVIKYFILSMYRSIHGVHRVLNGKGPTSPSEIVIVQFAARTGYIGGDTIANSLIKDALEEVGYSVKVVYVSEKEIWDNKQNSWLWGGKLSVYNKIIGSIPKDAFVIIDGQLNLGLSKRQYINIYHFSFKGYRTLVSINEKFKSRMESRINSKIQSIGSIMAFNVAVSEFQKRYLQAEGVKVDIVIPNTVDIEKFKPRNSETRIKDFLYVGGYNYYGKGIDILERLAEKGLKIDCLTNSKLDNNVLGFLGTVNHESVAEVMNNYKILIHPSRYESCSMSVLEAMSLGMPVLISNVGIGPELKKEIPEFVIDGYDDKAIDLYFSNALVIMKNYMKYSRLAREYVIRWHSPNRFKAQWAEVIRGICSPRSLLL